MLTKILEIAGFAGLFFALVLLCISLYALWDVSRSQAITPDNVIKVRKNLYVETTPRTLDTEKGLESDVLSIVSERGYQVNPIYLCGETIDAIGEEDVHGNVLIVFKTHYDRIFTDPESVLVWLVPGPTIST